MSNDISIANRGSSDIMEFEGLSQAFDAVQYSLPSASTDPYLRMNRLGEWIYGAEDFEVEAGSKWAINPLSFQLGYVCWSKNEGSVKNTKLGEIMGPANKPMPVKATLPDHGFPWSEQVSFSVVCVSGEDKGLQTKYATTSVGGINEVKQKLSKAVGAKIKEETARGATRETAKIVPIVTLANSFYNHAQYKKIFTPVFNIVGWATLDAEELPEDQPKVTNGGRRAAAPKTVVDEDGEVPFENAADAPRRRSRPRA